MYLRRSSFNRAHLLRLLKGAENPEEALVERLPCMTLSALVSEYWDGTPIDLLALDTEGHDADIIMDIDFGQLRPAAIVFELHNVGRRRDQLVAHLTAHGYRLIELGGDAAAVCVNEASAGNQ
jgi:hypothetical protein